MVLYRREDVILFKDFHVLSGIVLLTLYKTSAHISDRYTTEWLLVNMNKPKYRSVLLHYLLNVIHLKIDWNFTQARIQFKKSSSSKAQ